jgi:signal transduction histidine kinase
MLRHWFTYRLTVSQQFLWISLAILVSGMIVIGWWVSSRIEAAVIHHASSVTSLYMNTFIPPLLEDMELTESGVIDPVHQHLLEHLLTSTPLTEELVALKLWGTDATLLYSTDGSQVGRRFNDNPELNIALSGQVVSHISYLDKPEHIAKREYWTALIETYAPVRDAGTGTVIAVVETYQDAEPLLAQVRQAQLQSWLVVGVATAAMYALLSGLVHRASRTIARQQNQLEQSVTNLTTLLAENRSLHQRLQSTVERAAEINEQFLQRIGRDLHDGPAQDLALALLRIGDLGSVNSAQQETIRYALQSALDEIRSLAAGLQLPVLETLTTAEVARRAAREFKHKTGAGVDFVVDEPMPALSLLQKITIYRAIKEGLNNSYRHAQAKGLRGRLWTTAGDLCLEIADDGPGFDPSKLDFRNGHLGLVSLQQRVALLAGTFDIQSSERTGTRISVRLPLEGNEDV